MPVIKPTRPLAKRIDGDYVVRPHPMRSSRRALAWGAAVVAIGWFAWRGVSYTGERPRLAGTIANPGPVSSAHANFEHDCTACHTGGSGDRFMRGVTDAACLTCHDGAIHDCNQKIAADAHGVSRGAFTLAIDDAAHPHRMRSAACATCHVEHRDRPALAATSDAHCVVCHADLRNAARTPPRVAASVAAFDAARHPPFGRILRDERQKWADPTLLKFNHLAHKDHVKPPAGAAHNCAACHQTDRATGSADGRYMRAVNYAQHCRTCHPLEVGAGLTVAHEDLSLVRPLFADVGGAYRTILAVMTPEEREKALTGPGSSRGSRRSGGGGEKMTEDQWVKQQIGKLRRDVTGWFDRDRPLPGYAIVKAAATQPASDGVDPKVLEYFAVYGSANRCALCHEIDASKPALATAPTGIAMSPRRWFASSRFDHDAHRNVTCTDCHAGGVTSRATADVLLPDMTTRGAASGVSCVDCHHAADASVRAAPSACATCHLFHDRRMERTLGGESLSRSSP